MPDAEQMTGVDGNAAAGTRTGGPGPDTGGQAPQTHQTPQTSQGQGDSAAKDGGGQSLLSQVIEAGKKGEGTGDAPGEAGKDVKKGEPKEGEEGKEDSEKGTKPLTSADFADVIPEGKVWDEELGKSYLGIGNKYGIPKAALDEFLTLYSSQQDKMFAAEQAAQKAIDDMLAQEAAEWAKAAKADKEYGGLKWEASQAVIARGSQRLATPEAVTLFNDQKLGCHPEVLRMFYRAGLLLGEDGGLNAGGASNPEGRRVKGEALYKEYQESLKKAGIIKEEAR